MTDNDRRATQPGGQVITHRCKACNNPVEVGIVETSSRQDYAVGRRIYAWGRHVQCSCGSTDRPELVVDEASVLTKHVEPIGVYSNNRDEDR